MRIFLFWLPFAFLVTLFCGLVYSAVQQDYRMSANDPQIQIAEDTARNLELGKNIRIPQETIEISESLASYIAVYSKDGKLATSSGVLHGKTFQVPQSIFAKVKSQGESRFTWQPEYGVREAVVMVYYQGVNQSGYVLAGRSLREVEIREGNLFSMVFLTWVGGVIVSFILSVIYKMRFFRK